MRDLETTSAAITAAETGHLVLSTLHTNNAAQTIERIIDIYPGDSRTRFARCWPTRSQAVVCQMLFKRIDQPGMVPACEILICTPAVRNCIRENRIYEIPNVIETNRGPAACRRWTTRSSGCTSTGISRRTPLSEGRPPEALHRALSA